jgi:hypothetical protein
MGSGINNQELRVRVKGAVFRAQGFSLRAKGLALKNLCLGLGV